MSCLLITLGNVPIESMQVVDDDDDDMDLFGEETEEEKKAAEERAAAAKASTKKKESEFTEFFSLPKFFTNLSIYCLNALYMLSLIKITANVS